jgi:hypothetical protein
MTEAEWLVCTDSGKMLELFRGRRFDSRLRRFAVECCRRIRHLITEEVFRAAADAGEAFADDPQNEKSTIKTMSKASIEAWRHRRRYAISADRHQLRAADAAIATCASTDWNAEINAMREAAQAVNRTDADCCDPVELQHQAAILRCIFAPLPFRSITLDRAWLTPTVKTLAAGLYDEWAFYRLPILADALEEADCIDADVLAHCRCEGPHVRGCWVVDLILGKS